MLFHVILREFVTEMKAGLYESLRACTGGIPVHATNSSAYGTNPIIYALSERLGLNLDLQDRGAVVAQGGQLPRLGTCSRLPRGPDGNECCTLCILSRVVHEPLFGGRIEGKTGWC